MENEKSLKEELPTTPPPVQAQGEEVVNEPVKIKKRPKQLVKDEPEVIKVNLDEAKKVEEPGDIIKVDLRKPETKDETKENNADDSGVVELVEDANTSQEQEEVPEENKTQEESPILEEITDEQPVEEKPTQEEVVEAIAEKQETGVELPENIQKVVDFMNDTGGSLEDYVKLNTDYASLDEQELLREYYQNTKPHLTQDEISFLMEDNFSFDEEQDEEREVKKKKIALKEQVASAKNHLDGLKSKYYEEIKAGSRLAPEQKKAVDFFNRYTEEQAEIKKVSERQVNAFRSKTKEVFNDKFKGFEYNVGEKKYRYNVKNAEEVKTSQGDINNFVKKFLNKNQEMSDAAGYHKSLFTAMNPDAVANHFYNQGKADALKDSMSKAKNVDMAPRQGHTEIKQGGTTYKVISGTDTSKLRIKTRK
jgi:hypothetical protein|tara:strand:- start:1306 stop:2568 length:1263 start_codon:yes stop_codon:yes gene_type:complete